MKYFLILISLFCFSFYLPDIFNYYLFFIDGYFPKAEKKDLISLVTNWKEENIFLFSGIFSLAFVFILPFLLEAVQYLRNNKYQVFCCLGKFIEKLIVIPTTLIFISSVLLCFDKVQQFLIDEVSIILTKKNKALFLQHLTQANENYLFQKICLVCVALFLVLFLIRKFIKYQQCKKADPFFTNIRTVKDMKAKLNDQTFEDYIAYFYKKLGYDAERVGAAVENLQKSDKDGLYGDGGKDVILRKRFRKEIIVQCKFFTPPNYVDVKTVREMFGVMIHYKARKIIIVTTSFFSKDARSFAKGKSIELIDGRDLEKRIAKMKHF